MPAQALEALKSGPYLFLFAGGRLSGFGFAPEIRLGGLFEQFGLADFELIEVKDASRAYPDGPRDRPVVRAVRSASSPYTS